MDIELEIENLNKSLHIVQIEINRSDSGDKLDTLVVIKEQMMNMLEYWEEYNDNNEPMLKNIEYKQKTEW